jgi:hypothetical protein
MAFINNNIAGTRKSACPKWRKAGAGADAATGGAKCCASD